MFGRVACVSLWVGFRLNDAITSEAGAFLVYTFSREAKQFVTPYVLRSTAVSLKPDWFEGAVKVRRQAAMEATGMNGCQGTPWSEKLDGKDSIERLGGKYDLKSRGSAFYCTASQR